MCDVDTSQTQEIIFVHNILLSGYQSSATGTQEKEEEENKLFGVAQLTKIELLEHELAVSHLIIRQQSEEIQKLQAAKLEGDTQHATLLSSVDSYRQKVAEIESRLIELHGKIQRFDELLDPRRRLQHNEERAAEEKAKLEAGEQRFKQLYADRSEHMQVRIDENGHLSVVAGDCTFVNYRIACNGDFIQFFSNTVKQRLVVPLYVTDTFVALTIETRSGEEHICSNHTHIARVLDSRGWRPGRLFTIWPTGVTPVQIK